MKVANFCLLAWAFSLGIGFNIGDKFHIGPADILALPLAFFAFAHVLWKPIPPVVMRLGIFVGLFLTVGHLVAVLTLGRLTSWLLLNKDLGLIERFLCVLAISILVESWDQFKALTVAFVVGGSLLNLVGLALIPIAPLVLFGGVRYKGFMEDPNYWAGYLSIIAVFQLALLLFGGKRVLPVRPLYQWLNFFVLAFSIALTLSRGGMIAFFAGLVCCCAFAGWRARFALGAFACVCASLIWILAASGVADHLFDSAGISSRSEVNRAGLEMYSSSPASLIFGVGIGTFLAKAPSLGVEKQIHNVYLWLLVDGGPLLLAAFLWVVGTTAVSLLSGRKLAGIRAFSIGGFCAFVSCLVLFLSVEGSQHRGFWFLLGFGAVLQKLVATAKPAYLVMHRRTINRGELRCYGSKSDCPY